MKSNHFRHSLYRFEDIDTAPFETRQYSRMKFGSEAAACAMGRKLAEDTFMVHGSKLIANQCVVIPSPYNYVHNAATVMTKYFIDRINELLVNANGNHVEYSLIHRKVSYTNDYGFLSKEKRKELIDNDSFYFNRDFIEGKLLIFIDDVYITGTHEQKLIEIMERGGIENDSLFLYYARYYGGSPDIEAKINFAHIQTFSDYVNMLNIEECQIIVRPIKYVLAQEALVLRKVLPTMTYKHLSELYHGCLAEGYYKIPKYQENFQIIVETYNRNNV